MRLSNVMPEASIRESVEEVSVSVGPACGSVCLEIVFCESVCEWLA
jgi:hypothetical protein